MFSFCAVWLTPHPVRAAPCLQEDLYKARIAERQAKEKLMEFLAKQSSQSVTGQSYNGISVRG